jgi:exodeoxyribonuclease VII small subunit
MSVARPQAPLRELLRQAEARVEKITLDAAGKPSGTEPLDVA